jgi:hypothetical protein
MELWYLWEIGEKSKRMGWEKALFCVSYMLRIPSAKP